MLDFLIIVLRALAFSGGILLCVAAFLLDEKEEKEVQSRLANWWVALDDVRLKAHSGLNNVVVLAANITSSMLTSLYGRKLISDRCILTTTLLSMLSLQVVFVVNISFAGDPAASVPSVVSHPIFQELFMRAPSKEHLGQILLSIACLFALAPGVAFLNDERLTKVILLLLSLPLSLVLAIGRSTGQSFLQGNSISTMLLMSFAFLLAIASDLLSLYFTRFVLANIMHKRSLLPAALLLLVDGLLALALFVIPLVVMLSLLDVDATGSWTTAAGTLAMANVTTAIPSLAWIAGGALLVIHFALWPTIMRPIYSLARFDIFSKRKQLLALGVACLAIAIPDSPALAGKMLRLVAQFLVGQSF